MSVIVAIKKDGKVYLGADSQVTKGGSRLSLSNSNNYKIWKVKNVDHCLMGCVGKVKDSCAIRVIYDLIDEINVIHDSVDFDYVVKFIEPRIREELIEHKFIEEDKPYDSLDSRFMFIYKDKLFTIEYGSVFVFDDFVAIGSGECEAVGSLLSTQNIDDPVERIIRAIKASAAHDIYVDYPIIITDSDKTEFTKITNKNEKDFIKEKVRKFLK